MLLPLDVSDSQRMMEQKNLSGFSFGAHFNAFRRTVVQAYFFDPCHRSVSLVAAVSDDST